MRTTRSISRRSISRIFRYRSSHPACSLVNPRPPPGKGPAFFRWRRVFFFIKRCNYVSNYILICRYSCLEKETSSGMGPSDLSAKKKLVAKIMAKLTDKIAKKPKKNLKKVLSKYFSIERYFITKKSSPPAGRKNRRVWPFLCLWSTFPTADSGKSSTLSRKSPHQRDGWPRRRCNSDEL